MLVFGVIAINKVCFQILVSVYALIPLSELFGYVTDIRSLSKGRADANMEPSHFDRVPEHVAKTIIEQPRTATRSV